MGYELVAAVDLGSNSFRLQIGRVVDNQIYPLDNLKESVRLAAGLGPDRLLDEESQARAVVALKRFGERLRGFSPGAVRAVATNTFRVAKNARALVRAAEDALGFPIEIIAGREEARLIYVGATHAIPCPERQQLVVDIGGGSTEFIVGRAFDPIELESLYMGCVGYSNKYFPNGEVDRKALKEAELAASRELVAIRETYLAVGWDRAVGSSGSAKSLLDAMQYCGYSREEITRDGLERIKALLLKEGNLKRAELPIKADRQPVFLGGLAIMSAVFKAFELESMIYSDGALRLGVLYDLLGRYHHSDLRDATVRQFMRRYGVDERQATRVRDTALGLLVQLIPEASCEENTDARFLQWAALLHELGLSVAHTGYHKHSAYILGNADMPGFSRMDQARLSRLVLAHRGKLERAQPLEEHSIDWVLILCLRLAVLLHRSRDNHALPRLTASLEKGVFVMTADSGWLRNAPLTAGALAEESRLWQQAGRPLKLRARSGGRLLDAV